MISILEIVENHAKNNVKIWLICLITNYSKKKFMYNSKLNKNDNQKLSKNYGKH